MLKLSDPDDLPKRSGLVGDITTIVKLNLQTPNLSIKECITNSMSMISLVSVSKSTIRSTILSGSFYCLRCVCEEP